jgi:hypothetical protein
MCEVWYIRVMPETWSPKPTFLNLNKRHIMSLARAKKIMKWYKKKYGLILDISYKNLSKPK